MKNKIRKKSLIIFFITALFVANAQAKDKYYGPDPVFYAIGKIIDSVFDGGIGEIGLTSGISGEGNVYAMTGLGLYLRRDNYYTGFRGSLNPMYPTYKDQPSHYVGFSLGRAGKNAWLGEYRTDLFFEPNDYEGRSALQLRFTGEFGHSQSIQQSNRFHRSSLNWALSLRHAFSEEAGWKENAIMLEVLLTGYRTFFHKRKTSE